MNPLLVMKSSTQYVGNVQFVDPLQRTHHGKIFFWTDPVSRDISKPIELELYFHIDNPNAFSTHAEMEDFVNELLEFAKYAVRDGSDFPPIAQAVSLKTRYFDGYVWSTEEWRARAEN